MALAANKLPPRYAVSDWHTSNKLIRTNAERLRDSSHTVRQDARRLRNETDNHTRWTQHDSNTKLEKRIDDINEWRESLERCLSETDTEISALQKEKEQTERALDAKAVPLEVAVECLMLRENRVGIDLVRDLVEEQLHKEVEVIEGIKALLQQKISEGFEQLCLLQEARHQLHCDITDKHSALDIDNTCAQLHNGSSDIDFQVNPTRTVKGSVTPETWDAHSQYNKLRAEAEMKASERLREAIFATLEKTKNDLEAQRRATEYEYRKRIHETEQAKNELEWQQKNTKEEIETLQQDIQALKEAIEAKMAPMKVAQTRLENRTYRPNIELCRDIPQYQLCYEVREIEGSIKALMEKLQTAENTLENLLRDLARIEEDLAIKTNSLDLDYKCMDMRKKLVESQHDIEANDITDAQGTKQRTSSAKDKQVTIDRGSPQATRTNASPLKRSSLSRNTPLNGQTQIDTSQAGRLSQLEKDFLQTTYKASYDGRTNLRSGDLNRTLGKLSIADTHGNETRNKRQVLVD